MRPEWGCSCADFANEATGLHLERNIGMLPTDWREAAELYRRFGVSNLGDLLSQLLREVPVLQAKRGDVVMVDGALGVCRGEWAEFMDAMQPMKRATRAWSGKAGINLALQPSAWADGVGFDPTGTA